MTPDDDFRITVAHVRALRIGGQALCVSGMRTWGARHGLDWRTFSREGIPASVLLATGDALAARIVAQARAQQEQEGNHG